ncbi:MAG TPA: hypothetical protein VGL23_19830, partial [Chloroflexota bacterium]
MPYVTVGRRELLRRGALFVALGLTAPSWVARTAAAASARAPASGRPGVLVVVQLGGGNDGLNTIVPYGDAAYYKHRPTIGIKEKDVLKIDAHFGWQKSMGGMKRLYDEGKIAIVQGVGYAQPSFS